MEDGDKGESSLTLRALPPPRCVLPEIAYSPTQYMSCSVLPALRTGYTQHTRGHIGCNFNLMIDIRRRIIRRVSPTAFQEKRHPCLQFNANLRGPFFLTWRSPRTRPDSLPQAAPLPSSAAPASYRSVIFVHSGLSKESNYIAFSFLSGFFPQGKPAQSLAKPPRRLCGADPPVCVATTVEKEKLGRSVNMSHLSITADGIFAFFKRNDCRCTRPILYDVKAVNAIVDVGRI